MADTIQTVERTSESPHLRVGERLHILVAHREILANLVRKELKVKYAASVLGAVWSLLNPLVYLAVFSFVARVLGAGIPNYPVYLLSGLLAWNLFSASMGSGARAVLDNANLVKKVAFAREILPLSAVGVGLVDFALQSAVLLLYIIVSGYGLHLPELALWPLAFVTLVLLTVALSLWFSALNVRYRDVGHLLNIALLVWFWATPIVYAEFQVQQLAERATWFGIPRRGVLPAEPHGRRRGRLPPRALRLRGTGRGAGAGLVRQEPRVGRRDPHDHVRGLARGAPARVGLLLLALGRLRGGAVNAAIEVADVSKRFRIYRDKPTSLKQRVLSSRSRAEDFWALRDVALDVGEGSTFGLIGHNGSGKTTLLKCVAGILRPTSGTIRQRGRLAALLELGAGFHPELTGRENVYLNASFLGLSRRQTDAAFDDIVAFAELEDFIDNEVKFYSSGMLVRLGFAVAVHVDPDVLLIDEVLAVGDEAFQAKCLDRVRAFQREGRTIVLVTHALDTVIEICDRAAMLHHGELHAVGMPADVVREMRYVLLGVTDPNFVPRRAPARPRSARSRSSARTARARARSCAATRSRS